MPWLAFVIEAPAEERWTGVALAMELSVRTVPEADRSSRNILSRNRANRPIAPNLAPVQFPDSLPRMKSTDDTSTTVGELRERVMHFARERDWEQFHSPKNLSMALAAEAGELMEHFLWTESKASGDALADPKKREKIEEEIADVVIYALEFANIGRIDLAKAIEAKLAKNALKYPVEKAKGNSAKYTEL